MVRLNSVVARTFPRTDRAGVRLLPRISAFKTASALSLSAAKEKPAAASSNLVPPAGVEQLRRRCCEMQVENCRQELGKPLAFSSAHSPQGRASKLLGPPSREFDRSVFGPPRSQMTRAVPELPGYSK